MFDKLIGVNPADLRRLKNTLDNLPDEAADAAVDEVSEYLLNVFRLYPPEKRVSRRQAYGNPFFSDKQRRWFFAALKSGDLEIPYKRTQGFRDAWTKIDQGKRTMLANEADAAPYLMGKWPGEQSRMSRLIGWETMEQVTERRADRINEIMEASADKAMKKLGAK